MPVIISPEHYHDWLNKAANADDAYRLLDDPAYNQHGHDAGWRLGQ